jgi:hypothetical protein
MTMSYSNQRIRVAQGQLRVAAVGYVLLGVPACTAIALSMPRTSFRPRPTRVCCRPLLHP